MNKKKNEVKTISLRDINPSKLLYPLYDEKNINKEKFYDTLYSIISTLSVREEIILRLRYGLNTEFVINKLSKFEAAVFEKKRKLEKLKTYISIQRILELEKKDLLTQYISIQKTIKLEKQETQNSSL